MSLQRRVAVATLLAGATLAATPIAGEAGAAVPHTVGPGETLWSIAASNNFTTRTVAAYNGLAETATVTVGQTIQVPTVEEGAAALAASGVDTSVPPADAAAPAAATAPAAGGHVVVEGESLSSIAAANGITVDALAAANSRSSDSYVYSGESLSIPAATAATAPETSVPLGTVPSPYGEIPLEATAAASWNSMREESLNTYGQDLYPAGGISGYRTYEQQAQLYEQYLNGTGPLAAPPGTSSHETGTAVDLETPEMRSVVDQIGWSYGWGKTEAANEWWHINYGG